MGIVLSLLLSGAHVRAHTAAQSDAALPPESRRLESLQKEVESGRGGALNQFWQEVARTGAPLVEPIEGDDQNLLVTFLWRDRAAQKFVAVFPFARVNPLAHLLARLPGTDVWFRNYRMRRNARFEYLVSANDSLAPFAARDPNGDGGWRRVRPPSRSSGV